MADLRPGLTPAASGYSHYTYTLPRCQYLIRICSARLGSAGRSHDREGELGSVAHHLSEDGGPVVFHADQMPALLGGEVHGGLGEAAHLGVGVVGVLALGVVV